MENRIRKILYFIVTGLFFTALLKAALVEPVATILSSERQIMETKQWQKEKTVIPDGKKISYTCVIPESIGHEAVVCIKSYNARLEVFLEGESIYTYENDFGDRGTCWKWVELPQNVEGKQLTVQVIEQDTWTDPVVEQNIYLADRNTIFLKILKENLFSILLGTVNILMGSLICLGSWVLRQKLLIGVRKGLNYLGAFILVSGEWLLTDSSVLQFVTGRTTVVTLLSFCSFMLMPYFLLRFIRKMMVYRSRGLIVLAHLHLINAAVCIFLYLLHIAPLQKTLLGTHILLAISVVFVFWEEVNEVRKNHNGEMKIILFGMLGMIFLMGLAMVEFYRSPDLPYAVFYGCGILLFEIFLMRAVFMRMRYYLDNSAQAEAYREIAYKDSMTKLGNRLAFTRQQESGNWMKNRCYIVLDINNLKKVNDIYGNLEGDRLITDAATCIMEAFGDMGDCYRIGGDEFVVISDTISEECVQKSLDRLKEVLERVNQERLLPVEIAFGYAIRQSATMGAQELFDEADAQMYARKKQMKGKKGS